MGGAPSHSREKCPDLQFEEQIYSLSAARKKGRFGEARAVFGAGGAEVKWPELSYFRKRGKAVSPHLGIGGMIGRGVFQEYQEITMRRLSQNSGGGS